MKLEFGLKVKILSWDEIATKQAVKEIQEEEDKLFLALVNDKVAKQKPKKNK